VESTIHSRNRSSSESCLKWNPCSTRGKARKTSTGTLQEDVKTAGENTNSKAERQAQWEAKCFQSRDPFMKEGNAQTREIVFQQEVTKKKPILSRV